MTACETRWRSVRAWTFLCAAAAVGSSLACGSRSAPPAGPSAPTSSTPTPAPNLAPTPTPAPTNYSVTGVVRAVNGAPLAGVSVTARGPATTTGDAGVFSLAGITQTTILFQKAGFLYSYWSMPPGFTSGPGAPLSIKMQPRLELSADAGVSSLITNDESLILGR